MIKGQVLRFGEHNIAHLRKELHKAVDEQKELFTYFKTREIKAQMVESERSFRFTIIRT